ncbi:hypothetical protein A1O3_07132 [Capronia epimyces CBS 606.96]|uniref:Uncharacterized protein n=1 Tax=Capronia epimyces CBS 606.96 TaxID=1182542 RepID=W9XV47_9EURO|nr:uncharacterized protein A1O3_07132 [Capronia epimyces CBS 606.96]EXJ80846.1 hypothetical protein A1O3_07132 [Capronia epimyces CBS 606.96]
MDISSLVRAVTAAFEDASSLVQRIRDQRKSGSTTRLPEEPTRELLESLALGPVIVRGHYDHDLKRFGEPYACGDIQAREQMKDVLINLQMTLIITLRSVYMDEMDLDFNTLQTASDDCRVNAGVCLGQLSQRLSDAVKAQACYPQNMAYSSSASLMPPMSPSLGYSSSRSTQSSAAFAAPQTPDTVMEQFGNLAVSPPVHPPYMDRKMSMRSGDSQERRERTSLAPAAAEFQITVPPIGVHKIDDPDAMSLRRRSSQALASDDNILLLFPQPGGQPIVSSAPSGKEPDRGSFGSSGRSSQGYFSPDVSRASSGHRSQNSRDRYGPDDYGEHEQTQRSDGRQYSHGTIYDMYQPSSPEKQPSSTSYSTRAQAANHSSLDYVRYLQENSRPPRALPRTDSLTPFKRIDHIHEHLRHPVRLAKDAQTSRQYESSPSFSTPIPVDSRYELRSSPSNPTSRPPSHHQSTGSRHLSPTVLSSSIGVPSIDAPSVHTVASSTPSVNSAMASGPVMLPTDKNLMGFCKGAFRLQAGLERKAFSLVNRPAGLASMITSWKCEKCNFEGPVYESVGVAEGKKKGKSQRSFDPKVRTSEGGGVRYRWAFLARCHVALKAMVPTNTALGREGGFGSYGCIFCCAEGRSRGWLDAGNALASGAASSKGSSGSVRSGNTANTAIKITDTGTQVTTPIFGNVASFMDHLETVHRGQDGWPNAEMVGRFRVVLGRVAPAEEHDWEINFVPF